MLENTPGAVDGTDVECGYLTDPDDPVGQMLRADLAQALVYEQINYYGVSYGTMLGQHLVRLHPEVVRTFILDAIVPLNVNAFQRSAHSFNRSLDQLFAGRLRLQSLLS